jgi:multidrug efflux system membrane fusion protein
MKSTPSTRSLLAITLLALVLASCENDKKPAGPQGGRRGPVQFPVTVEKVEVREVEYAIRAVGTIDVFERVQVVARVTGAVEKVSFREGQEVKAGATLVAIDPARHALAARDAKAAVARAEAARAEAVSGLARRTEADQANPGLIPGEEIETWRTRVATAEADLSQRKVAVERAALDLRDAYVRAPVSGTIQTRSVETGQYVQPGAVLATLVRREPLLLRFDVPEAEAARLKKGMPARFTAEGQSGALTASIVHVAEVADPTSRMVRVTSQIDDPRRGGLRAGGFAQVTVPFGGAPAPVIVEAAVRPSERGFLAYVVEGDGDKMVARERVVELGLRTGDGRVEIKKGIAGGDRIVVRGAEALRDGAPVKIGGPETGKGKPKPPGAPSPSPSPSPSAPARTSP